MDSDFLISLIESWAMDGASVIVGGILMTVDYSNCSVNILSLDEEEEGCSVGDNSTPDSSNTIFFIAAISGWSVAGALVAIVVAVCVVKRCCRKQTSTQKTEQ